MVREIVGNKVLNQLVELHIFKREQEGDFLSAYSTDLNDAWRIVLHFGLWYGFRSKTNIKSMEVAWEMICQRDRL